MRTQKREDQLPQLGLRSRLVIEKVLPIYRTEDFKALKITSTQQRIITQRIKLYQGSLSEFHFALITVTHHEPMECWIWQIYFAATKRTFIVTFFASDLFNMNQSVFKHVAEEKQARARLPQPAQNKVFSEEELLWRKLIEISDLQVNKLGDVHMKIDSF